MSAAASIPTRSQTAFFGRAWKVTIDTQAGEHIEVTNSDWKEEALRVTFSVETYALVHYWTCDLEIWNMSVSGGRTLGAESPTNQIGQFSSYSSGTNAAITKGDVVTISAGYQKDFDPVSNAIWNGRVFQVAWEKDDAANIKLKIRCLIGLWEDERNQVSITFREGTTLGAMAEAIANQANMTIAYIDPVLYQNGIPRGQSVFARPTLLLNQIAAAKKLNFWYGANGIVIRSLAPDSEIPDVVYSPPLITDIPNARSSTGVIKQTLIGCPQQTEQGISFRVLLDTGLQLGQLVKIDQAVVRIQPKYPDPKANPSLLDQDGVYVVMGIRHTGDTRGNEWYTEVDGVTRQFGPIYQGIKRKVI